MQFFETLLGSPRCIICGSRSCKNDYPVCNECCENIKKQRLNQWNNCCYICGIELISELNICLKCRDKEQNYHTHYSLFSYNGIPRYILRQYKFRKQRGLEFFFAEILYEYINKSYTSFPIVPVPSHKPIFFKQSYTSLFEKVCLILRKRYSLNVYPVLGMKNGKKQKTLNAEERIMNIKNRVTVNHNIRKLFNKPVLVLDDVFTTGATLKECSKVLLDNGIKEVHAVTLYRD